MPGGISAVVLLVLATASALTLSKGSAPRTKAPAAATKPASSAFAKLWQQTKPEEPEQGAEVGMGLGGESAVPWEPPAGQRGDGRTWLNAKLGY